jgi:hypothetical protein
MSDFRSGVRKRVGGVAAAAFALGAYLVLAAVPAQAVVACVYDAVNREITVTADGGDTATLLVGAGGAIEVNGVACGVATVNNTDGVNLTDNGGGDVVFVIDLTGGPFAPGETPEATGVSEIEFNVTFESAGAFDQLVIQGGSADDTLIYGDAGVNLNNDNDVDVTLTPTSDPFDDMFVNGGGGNDVISAAGGAGTGDDFDIAEFTNNIDGEDGNDTLTGSDVFGDNIQGGEGNDSLTGLGLNDNLDDDGVLDPGTTCATDETDTLNGGNGDDVLSAGTGRDTLLGGQGVDIENGENCSDTFDEEDGPNGGDTFNGGNAEPGGVEDCDPQLMTSFCTRAATARSSAPSAAARSRVRSARTTTSRRASRVWSAVPAMTSSRATGTRTSSPAVPGTTTSTATATTTACSPEPTTTRSTVALGPTWWTTPTRPRA